MAHIHIFWSKFGLHHQHIGACITFGSTWNLGAFYYFKGNFKLFNDAHSLCNFDWLTRIRFWVIIVILTEIKSHFLTALFFFKFQTMIIFVLAWFRTVWFKWVSWFYRKNGPESCLVLQFKVNRCTFYFSRWRLKVKNHIWIFHYVHEMACSR